MKPRVGFFDFTGCEGCQLTILNLSERLLDVLDLVEVVEFREVQSGEGEELDFAFVEGSICRADERERLLAIRERSKKLITLGACADLAGINTAHQHSTDEDLVKLVYGCDSEHLRSGPAQPVSAIVPIDARIPGCPVDGEEFLTILHALLLDRPAELPAFPVCVECKLAELPCTFEKGVVCLGPVVRAGCDALCVEGGDRCRGCRGLVDNPREGSYHRVLNAFDLTVEDILEEYRIYNLQVDDKS
jgi:coenzyme F420-reducing hydrogenase gamma subunit